MSSVLVLYHGTNLKHAPVLRERSYVTSDFWVAASYGMDKNPEEFYVYSYVVKDPFEVLNPEDPHWKQLTRLESHYNHDMGHDAYQNNEPLKPSGKRWVFTLNENTPRISGRLWERYDVSPAPPSRIACIIARYKEAVIRKEKGQYCVRSPNNKSWNGGCFDSKEDAEARLREVEFFKRK